MLCLCKVVLYKYQLILTGGLLSVCLHIMSVVFVSENFRGFMQKLFSHLAALFVKIGKFLIQTKTKGTADESLVYIVIVYF
jgi:hypothetical protein